MYGLLYGLAEFYFLQEQRQRELLRSEIAFLRSQINPHFLFNSINDIYALTLTRPVQAPNALLKLSDLLRYALYSSKAQLVPLADEINYLQSYIELENIGNNGKACVQTVFSGAQDHQYIAPMLLIPFVENAIKHGVIQSTEYPIEVMLKAEAARIEFRCLNRKRAGNKDITGGISLANIRRRLELEYRNRYELSIKNTEQEFEVNLSLIL